MAANYWGSTQRKFWSFTPDKLADMREDVERQHAQLLQQHPYPDRRLMFIFIKDRLLQLAKRVQFRQQCVATALLYMQRFFLSTPMQNVNIYLLIATAFYLASKTEESPHHIRIVAAEARQAWQEFVSGDVSRMGEMEFCLISEMRSQLIVWHPYRTLIDLKDDQELKLTGDELSIAWAIINDSYLTDLPLTHPPHLVAVIAVFLSVVFQPFGKATAPRPYGLDGTMNLDAGSFPSVGARPGMGTALGTAIHGLPMNPPGHPSANQNGTNGVPKIDLANTGTDKAKAVAAFQSSEKFQSMVKFLVESEIDLKQMAEGIQQLISLYTVWEEYNEKAIKEAVSRCLKANSFDN